MAFGISAPRRAFVSGENVSLHLWVHNTDDALAGVMTCDELDYFKSRRFDLYDAYGHRVLDTADVRFLERCQTSPNSAQLEMGWGCTRNFSIPIPAHTCVTGNGYDFTINLSERFSLPPGEYTVRFRHNLDIHPRSCGSQEEPAYQSSPSDLRFAIVQP